MQYIWSSRIDKILEAGHSLLSAGIRNWALDRGAALAALDEFFAQGISVLGGYIYTLAGKAEDIDRGIVAGTGAALVRGQASHRGIFTQ